MQANGQVTSFIQQIHGGDLKWRSKRSVNYTVRNREKRVMADQVKMVLNAIEQVLEFQIFMRTIRLLQDGVLSWSKALQS